MGWGDPTFNRWGGFNWGQDFFSNFARFNADVVAKLQGETAFESDVVAEKTLDAEFDADVVAEKTGQKRFEVDVFGTRLPTDLLAKRTSKPVALFEIKLRTGTIFLSGRSIQAGFNSVGENIAWDGRVIDAAEISRGVGDVTDDLSLTIDDTTTNGPKISALFTDADPPEGVEVVVYILDIADPEQNLIEVFRGRIEEVSDLTPDQLTIQVVRSDAVLDRTIGRLADSTIFPNAPEETIGKMIPIVFGDVDPSEGIISDFNAVSQLSQSISEDIADPVLVRDASEFPTAGEAHVGNERFTWTSKTGNQLLGVVRGTGGTQIKPHPSGTDVSVRGTFEVVFSDHASTSIEDIRLLDTQGNLRAPEQSPTIDAPNGKVSWARTPTVLVPSQSTEVLMAAYETAGGTNTAVDPKFAARESTDFTDTNFATVPGSGGILDLERATDLGDPGVITRAGVLVSFDPLITGATVEMGGLNLGTLSPGENLPDWILRRFERQTRATYSIDDPGHSHPATTGVSPPQRHTINLTANQIEPQGWDNPGNFTDGNSSSFAGTSTQSSVALPVGNNNPLEAVNVPFSLGAGQLITAAKFTIVWGGQATSQPVSISLQSPFGPIHAMITSASGGNFSKTVTEFVIPAFGVTRLQQTIVAGRQSELKVVVVPQNPPPANAFPKWRVWDHFYEFTIATQQATVTTGVFQRRGFMNFFDITGLVGGDWDAFTDVLKAGSIRINNGTGTAHRISGVYLAIEHNPLVEVTQETPRVFSRVRGLVPTGEPTEISKAVIKNAEPLGLGLTDSQIAIGPYARAALSLAGDSIRQDFTIYDQVSGVELISNIAEQADLRHWWDKGFHFIKRKPDPDSLDSVFKRFDDNDVNTLTSRQSRSRVDEIVNKVQGRFNFNPKVGDFTKIDVQSDAGSITIFGTFTETFEMGLIRDPATAAIIVARMLKRRKNPRWIVRFRVPLIGLDLERGDLVELNHTQFQFLKAEILEIPLVVSGFKTVEVVAVIWEK